MKAIAACAALLLFLAPAFAEAKKQKPAEKEKESSSPYDAATRAKSGDAITNEDLERMMEERPDVQLGELPPAPPPAPAARPAPAKPKPKLQAQSRPPTQPKVVRRSTPTFVPLPRAQGMGAADSKVAALESRVAALEKAILAAKNPALPREWTRPQGVPPGSLQDRQMQLRRAREELSAARQELAQRRASAP